MTRLLLGAALLALVAGVAKAADHVFGVGDVDGDGYDDVVLPAGSVPGAEAETGVFLFLGSAGGIADFEMAHAAAHFVLDDAGAHIDAASVIGADVNGDGYDDIAMLSRDYQTVPQLEGGLVMIFLGGAEGLASGDPTTADTTLQTDLDGWIGALAAAGDLDGDAYDDVLVGNVNPAKLFWFRGTNSGIPSGGAALAASEVAPDYPAGWTGTGDVNGDGYGDLVGLHTDSWFPDTPPFQSAHLLLGSAAGPLDTEAAEFADANGRGKEELALGNLNGDAYDDVVITYPYYGADQRGWVFVFYGSASGIAGGEMAAADASLEAGPRSFLEQSTPTAVLDFDGDGYDDVVLADPVSPVTSNSHLYLWRGGPGGPTSGSLDDVAIALDRVAFGVKSVGDLNGDGSGDVALPGFQYDEILYGPEAGTSAGCAVAIASLAALARRHGGSTAR